MHLLEKLLQSVRRLCHTHASGNNRQAYPPLKIRILKSISSPKRILENPPNALYTSARTPILKTTGIEFIHFFSSLHGSSGSKKRSHGIIYCFLYIGKRIMSTVRTTKKHLPSAVEALTRQPPNTLQAKCNQNPI